MYIRVYIYRYYAHVPSSSAVIYAILIPFLFVGPWELTYEHRSKPLLQQGVVLLVVAITFQLQPRRTPVRCQKSRPGVSHHQPLGAWVHPKVHLGICKDKLWNFIKPQINLVGTDRTIYPTFTGPRGLKSQWLPGHVLIRKTMFLATRIQTSNIGV